MDPNTYLLFTLRAGLRLLAIGIKPNTQWSKKNVLHRVSGFTGRKYKLTQVDLAIEDLTKLIEGEAP